MIFKDRQDAGKKLAAKLLKYKNNPDVIILGLPRGGVIVAYEIARELNLPLDVVVPRKIGTPGNPELAIGAITEDGQNFFDEKMINDYRIGKDYINDEIEKEKTEAERRLKIYRGKRQPLNLKSKIAILVDDGIATGATMIASIRSAKNKGAKQVIVAVPTTASDSLKKISQEADRVIYLDAPLLFFAVGEFYQDFPQTTDAEVIELLSKAKQP
ncbi:MAG: phosphoribosyltransferase [Candidatus Harrisonbacteria bacterium]|nr:phosphoribosyltransferase [Candidatus Harrisonbacteria bacterium]